jgi:tetratricopeptide (TPR) repeat protein
VRGDFARPSRPYAQFRVAFARKASGLLARIASFSSPPMGRKTQCPARPLAGPLSPETSVGLRRFNNLQVVSEEPTAELLRGVDATLGVWGALCGVLTAMALFIIFAVASGSFAGTARASASSARIAFAAAQTALDRGDLNSALADVQEGLHSAPASIAGLNLLGIILARQGKNQQALNAFNLALKANPRSVATHDDLGMFYVVLKQPQLAEIQFRDALKQAPTDRDANYNLGVVLLSEGRPRDAIQCFRRIQPPDSQTLFNLTRAYLITGQTQQALHRAKMLSEQNHNSVPVHFSLGTLLASEKQYEPAERELETADALAPDTFEILYNLGETYLEDGKAGRAELILRRASTLRPGSAETLDLLAQAETAEGKDVDALDLLVRAHHLAPRNADIIFLMARLSMKQSYYEDAIPLLEQGLKIAPDRADLQAALGKCYFMVGKPDKAHQEFQTLIKLHPTAASYAFMGFYYRGLYQFDEARKYFLLGLAKDPKNSVCLYNLGLIASRQGDYAGAEKWLERAIGIDGNYKDALFALASVKMSERKYAEAVPLLRKCTTLDRHPSPDYYKLMIAERNLHETQAAARELKIYKTLSKDSETAPYPFEHLFDYLNKLEGMAPQARKEVDLGEILAEIKRRPGEPRNFYMLAEAYLQVGQRDEAEEAVARLDELSGGDARTLAGVGVLLARYHLYPEAIRHFEKSLQADPSSDDVKYDLADAYFRTRQYGNALSALNRISPAGQKDDSVLALLADTDAHLGRTREAVEMYRDAIRGSPDNDQNYLSLALAQMQAGQIVQAHETLNQGFARIPDSGKLFWGMGILFAAKCNPQQAIGYLKRSVELLPEWPGSYAALGILYFQTGQLEKSRAVLTQLSQNGLQAAFNVRKIEEVLSAANGPDSHGAQPTRFSARQSQQFLQLALALADETL